MDNGERGGGLKRREAPFANPRPRACSFQLLVGLCPLGKVNFCFQDEMAQNHTVWGGTYLYGMLKGILSVPDILLTIHTSR